MLALSEQGDNSRLGLKSTMIASSFGKVFKKGEAGQKGKFSAEDISRSLLYAVSNNIGQIAYVCLWSSSGHGFNTSTGT
jgi:pantothenate kinase